MDTAVKWPDAMQDRGKQMEGAPACRTLIFYDHVERQIPHTHRFIELLLSLDGEPIEIDYDGNTVSSPAQIVAPLRRHAIIRCGSVARLYVALGLKRLAPLAALPIVVQGDWRSLAHSLRQPGLSADLATEEITLGWQQAWLPGFDDTPYVDPRIARSLFHVNAKANPQTNRSRLSQMTSLSPGRFGALFKEEMGMPLGRYIIWRRILIALEYLKSGKTITNAAAASGFSDAPHLCRCYRETFGSPPSKLPVDLLIQHGAGLKFLTQD